MTEIVDVAEAVLKTLAVHLKTLPSVPVFMGTPFQEMIEDVREHFPDPDEQLGYPTLSLDLGVINRTPQSPMKLRNIGEYDPDDVDAESVYQVGSITATIQADLWSSSPPQRSAVGAAFLNTMRADVLDGMTSLIIPAGPDYADEPIAYTVLSGGNYLDRDAAVQRREWRRRFTIRAELREIVVATVARIIDLRLDTTVCDSTSTAAQNPESQIIFQP